MKNNFILFLDKLSKKVGLNLSYFLVNGFWVGLRYALLAVTGLFLSISFTKLSDKEFIGQYQFVISFLSTVSLFALPGLNTATLKAVTEGNDGAIRKAVKLSFFVGMIGVPIVVGWGVYEIFFESQIILGWAFIVAGIIFPFFNAPNTWYVYYEGKILFKSLVLRTIFINLITTSGLVIGLFAKVNLVFMISIYFLSNAILHGIFYLEVLKKIKKINKNVLDVKYGIYVSVQKFIFGLYNNIPPLAISFVFGFENLAIYYITYFALGTISGLLSSLSSIYVPLLFKNIKLDYRRIIFQNIFVGIFFLVGFLFFLRYIFLFIYGEEYVISLKLGYLLAGILILMPMRVFLVNYFTTQKRNSLIIFSFIFSNIVSFLLFYLSKNTSFLTSVSIYSYSLQICIVGPLLIAYFSTASRKIDSMRSEMMVG